jgi:hypothetical protein
MPALTDGDQLPIGRELRDLAVVVVGLGLRHLHAVRDANEPEHQHHAAGFLAPTSQPCAGDQVPSGDSDAERAAEANGWRYEDHVPSARSKIVTPAAPAAMTSLPSRE